MLSARGCYIATGSSCTSAKRMAHTFLGVRGRSCWRCVPPLTDVASPDGEFTQLMKGLQGERLRQAFKYLDKDQDGYIRPEQFKKIILVRSLTSCHDCMRYTRRSLDLRTLLAINCPMPS